MSIRFPDLAQRTIATTPPRLAVPSGAVQKPANTAFVTGIFFKTADLNFEDNINFPLLTRGNGTTGGNDWYIRFSQNHTVLDYAFRSAGSVVASGTVAVDARSLYCLMLISTATNTWLAVCKVGGEPTIAAFGNTTLFTSAITTAPLWAFVGSSNPASSKRGWPNSVSDLFYCRGSFPLVSDAPDATLIQNITNGVQDIGALDAQLTGGVKQCWYRMTSPSDLADAYGLASALTTEGLNPTNGLILAEDGPLRPVGLTPAMTGDCVSQVTFASTGTNGTATVRTEGGAYDATLLGGTPASIQARLLDEAGNIIRDWTTVDAAPTGGTWAAGSLAAVPMTASWLTLQFRALNSGGTQIGPVVASYGRRGAGFCVVTQGQSQLDYLYTVGGGVAWTANIRCVVLDVGDSGNPRQQRVQMDDPANRLARGIRRAAEEIHARFSGVPQQYIAIQQPGTSLDQYKTGGTHAGRWASAAAFLGVLPDYVLLMYGHSSSTSGGVSAYQADISAVVSLCAASLGAPKKVIQCPVARYSLGSDTAEYARVRPEQRAWVAANPATAFWGGSWAVVATGESSVDSDPHPADTDQGQGRSGALLAWALMMASNAVEMRPQTITAAVRSGTTVTLSIGSA